MKMLRVIIGLRRMQKASQGCLTKKVQHVEKIFEDNTDARCNLNPFDALVKVNEDEGKSAGGNL